MSFSNSIVNKAFSSKRTKIALSMDRFNALMLKIKRKYYNLRSGPFPLKDFQNVFTIQCYLRLGYNIGSPLRSQAEQIFQVYGCPRFLDQYVHLLPNEHLLRLSADTSIELVSAGLISKAENLISTRQFLSSIDNIQSWLDTNQVLDKLWIKQYSVPKSTHSFTISSYFTNKLIKAKVGSTTTSKVDRYFYLQNREFNANYANCFAFFFNAHINSLDTKDFNIQNNIKYFIFGYSNSDITTTTEDLLLWYFDGNEVPKSKGNPLSPTKPRNQVPSNQNPNPPVNPKSATPNTGEKPDSSTATKVVLTEGFGKIVIQISKYSDDALEYISKIIDKFKYKQDIVLQFVT